jgi:hypothetical protein
MVSKPDKEVRESMLGELVALLPENGFDYIPIVLSVYLGIRIFFLLIKAADSQRLLEQSHINHQRMRRNL